MADDAKCQDGVAKGSRNVGNQEQKKNRKCVKDGSGDIDGCVDAESAKAAIKRTKLQDLFAPGGKCDPVPALGVNADPNDIADDTEDASGDILRAVFGDPVDGIVLDSKCHDKIAKRAGKKFDTELKAFRSCIKDAAPVANQGIVDGCISTGVNDAKAQGTVQPKLEADMDGQCDLFPVPGSEDGSCSGCTDATSCANCIGTVVDCEACLAMNNSSNSAVDCDLIDDGNTGNNSCPPGGGPPPTCPVAAGRYTLTQVAGGTLQVDGGVPFAFPAGGTVVQDVAAATFPNCVHDVVVPFPGGFAAPTFCSVLAFSFSTSLEQIGCGKGYLDSNGGSDFTVTERGDTSSPVVCGLGQACTLGVDNSLQVNLTLGDGVADTCPGGGTVNSFVGIPVHTLTWQDLDGDCPDLDGQYDPGDDTLVTDFNQNLDFTTDGSNADWEDLDPDGCCIRGSGPGATNPPGVCNTAPAGLSATGVCMDLGTMTVTTGSTGMVGSTGAPLYDLTFSSTLPNTVALTGPFVAGGCPGFVLPPSSGGTITRCIP